MSDVPEVEVAEPASVYQNPAVRTYLLLGLGALAVLLLTTLQRGAAVGALLATIIGVMGLLVQWRTAPVVLLFIVSASLFDWTGGRFASGDVTFDLGDILLTAALVTYLGAQYRLYSLTGNSLPVPPKRPGRATVKQPPRPAELVNDAELLALGAAGLAAAVAAQALWAVMPTETGEWMISPKLVHLAVLTLVLGGGGLLASWVLAHLAFRRAGPLAAVLYLQDLLWAETRREQRRQGRWIAWARLRVLRKRR